MVGKEISGTTLGFRGNLSFLLGETAQLYLFGRIRELEKLTHGVLRERTAARAEDPSPAWDWKLHSSTGGQRQQMQHVKGESEPPRCHSLWSLSHE